MSKLVLEGLVPSGVWVELLVSSITAEITETMLGEMEEMTKQLFLKGQAEEILNLSVFEDQYPGRSMATTVQAKHFIGFRARFI